MDLFLDAVDTSRIHISDFKYISLYPLLASYWDKPLIELPENLRNRVRDAVQSWDEIESQNPPITRGKAITIKQERIKWFDIKRDYSQEWETYIALQGYIKGGYQIGNYPSGKFIPDQNGYEIGILPERIAEARAASRTNIADMLERKVKIPLERIIREHGVHWPNSDPALWKALSTFKEITLAEIINEFNEQGNEECLKELKQVDLYLMRILRLDGSRINRKYPLLEEEIKKNANAILAHSNMNIGDTEIVQSNSDSKIQDGSIYKSESIIPVDNYKKCVIRKSMILNWLRQNNLDHENLPLPQKNGLAGFKAICKKELCKNKKIFSSASIFDREWQNLRDNGEIKDAQ